MRTIKFRCFYRGNMYAAKELSDDPMYCSAIDMYIEDFGCVRTVSPDQEHVKGLMQFTGLMDKNGKEIYEGDILKYILTDVMPEDEGTEYTEEVQFNHGCFEVDGHVPVSVTCDWQCEVIGNIHENPELL